MLLLLLPLLELLLLFPLVTLLLLLPLLVLLLLFPSAALLLLLPLLLPVTLPVEELAILLDPPVFCPLFELTDELLMFTSRPEELELVDSLRETLPEDEDE